MTEVLKPVETALTLSLPQVRTVKGQVFEVFIFWKNLLSNARSQLDTEREKKIAERLRNGYTADDLKLACIGCYLSDFHARGVNDRHRPFKDIELICRSARHVDQFIDIAEREAERILDKRAKDQAVEQERERPISEETREKIDALMAKLNVRRK